MPEIKDTRVGMFCTECHDIDAENEHLPIVELENKWAQLNATNMRFQV
jgi:hypothetical protein